MHQLMMDITQGKIPPIKACTTWTHAKKATHATIKAQQRIAVVTGANKGIGFEISKQLASNGVKVILTARDEKRGNEAIEKLKAAGYSHVIFHQLDVVDTTSISSFANFIKTQFGKLDVLVHNPTLCKFHQNPVWEA
ncbi:salutaridine reductase-like [Alnus glutinosa]|uniref:salutaridine reductase-like n=1 Tax=Alnus glutinosa TaxID=3517 RepID=UPI002D776F33|nr:salutaridine reductase-like [Alnus glutinosa]